VPFRTDRHACGGYFHAFALGLVCLAVAGRVLAQTVDRGVEFEDLGFTRAPDVSARAAGIAGFVSTANDATALVYNPAGLCRIKQRAPVLALARESMETVTTYGGFASGLSSHRVGLQFLGGAAAIPVFKGSLVPAAAVYRAFTSDLDIAYEADNPTDGRADAFRLQQSGSTFAFAIGFGIDLASVLSAGVSGFALEGGYHALRQSHTRTQVSPAAVDRYVIDDIDGDLDGVGARIGLTLDAHRHAHLSFNFTSPTLVNATANQNSETTEVVENSTGSTVRRTSATSAEYIIPYRIDGGIAIPWGPVLVALQAGVCDWSLAAIDGHRLRLANGSALLGRVIDYRAGVEWTAPGWPIRLRAGMAQLPFAPDYIQADRVDNDRLEAVVAETAPLRLSFGAGVAFKHTILIDVALTHTRGERKSSSFSEEREWSQVMIEGSYWF
jgi:hypothetical protein